MTALLDTAAKPTMQPDGPRPKLKPYVRRLPGTGESEAKAKAAATRKANNAARERAKTPEMRRRTKDKRAVLVLHHANKRRAAKLNRCAPWAALDAIRAIYEEAKRLTLATGILHVVDHEIPLQGSRVSGLHVETNLQILAAVENSRKRNKYEVK